MCVIVGRGKEDRKMGGGTCLGVSGERRWAMGEAEHHVFRYPSLPAQNTSYEQKEGKMSSWEAMEKAQVGKSAMSH